MSDGWSFDRLASRHAILFADLVESARLFQQDEARTYERWQRFALQVRDVIGPGCGARVVRVVGDSVLMALPSAGQAARAAFALHEAVAEVNRGAAAERAFALRTGLHEAEVVLLGDDVQGSGVNVAQRLSTLAQPGGTVASAALRAALGDGVQADIQDLGERVVKHLAEPVRAFALAPPGERPQVRLPPTEDLRPALAVVPFVALPADPQHDALGHALADDVIASLSRHPGLRVLSRTSTAAVRGQALSLPRMRELLGASFLLTGQFYVRGSRMRLSAELAELREGQVLWAGSVGGNVDALFEGQDDLVPHLVGQVSQQVLAHELARVRALPMDSLASYSLLLGAEGLLSSLVRSDFERARHALEHLAERHPRQAAPQAALSEWHIVALSQGWSPSPREATQQALSAAKAAIDVGPEVPAANVAMGVALSFMSNDYVQAGEHYRRALQLDPNYAKAHARLSEVLSEAGEHESALESAQCAIRLSPLDPWAFVYECAAARSAYMMRDFAMAELHARRSVRLNATHAPGHRHLIAALWQQGDHAGARHAANDFLRLVPGASVNRTHAAGADDAGDATSSPFVQILHQAGVPLR